MIYICLAADNHASHAGLVLWKLRKVFQELPREYHILAVDDGCGDAASETLETYQRALPMTLIRHDRPRGYAASLEELLRDAVRRTDRPKRDCAVTLPADFSVSPAVLPELVKRFESGADLVVGERVDARGSLAGRLVRRLAPRLLKPGVSVPGVRDLLSQVCAIRLVTLRNCLRDAGDPLLHTDGVSAYVELVARAAVNARQISTAPLPAAALRSDGESSAGALSTALNLYRAGRRVRIRTPAAAVRRSA